MKNINAKPNSEREEGLGQDTLKLLIESLADLIAKVRIDLLQQSGEILAKLREVNDSVGNVRREIQRHIQRGDS